METITTIDRLRDHVGQTVTLRGWVYKTRASGKIAFIVVRDGTGLCQCVLERSDATESFFADANKLGQESALTVTGTVKADDRAVGGHELSVTNVTPVHATSDYPITP
ncbi:MAG: OB-fold nucleic acid binding domain-containing protein, partial [Phycisphaerae bacterium]